MHRHLFHDKLWQTAVPQKCYWASNQWSFSRSFFNKTIIFVIGRWLTSWCGSSSRSSCWCSAWDRPSAGRPLGCWQRRRRLAARPPSGWWWDWYRGQLGAVQGTATAGLWEAAPRQPGSCDASYPSAAAPYGGHLYGLPAWLRAGSLAGSHCPGQGRTMREHWRPNR